MPLGLGRPQSVGTLTRRVELALTKSRQLRRTIEKIEAQLADRQKWKMKHTRRKKKIDLPPDVRDVVDYN